jgi:hypothetical protein
VAVAIEALIAQFDLASMGLRGARADHIVLRSEEAVTLFAAHGLGWVHETKHARALLRQLGFRSGTHRDRGEVVRGYKISRAELDDLAARHLSPETGEPDSPDDEDVTA